MCSQWYHELNRYSFVTYWSSMYMILSQPFCASLVIHIRIICASNSLGFCRYYLDQFSYVWSIDFKFGRELYLIFVGFCLNSCLILTVSIRLWLNTGLHFCPWNLNFHACSIFLDWIIVINVLNTLVFCVEFIWTFQCCVLGVESCRNWKYWTFWLIWILVGWLELETKMRSYCYRLSTCVDRANTEFEELELFVRIRDFPREFSY